MVERKMAKKVTVNHSEKRTATLGGLHISHIFHRLGNMHLTNRADKQLILEDIQIDWLKANVPDAIIKTVRVTTTVEDIEE